MKTLLQFMFVWSSLTLFVLVGCEKEEDDKLNQAQACLNAADVSSDATNCLSIIEGIQGEKAAKIRCALKMLENNITEDDIVDAFELLKTDSATASPILLLSNALALGSTDTEVALADAQLDICEASNSPGLITLANAIYMGTLVKDATADNAGDPNNIVDIEANLTNVPAAQLGAIGSSIYGIYCTAETNSEICNCLRNAGAGSSDATTIGTNLQTDLADQNCE